MLYRDMSVSSRQRNLGHQKSSASMIPLQKEPRVEQDHDGDSDIREMRTEEGMDVELLPHLLYRLHTESGGVDMGEKKGERGKEGEEERERELGN